MTQRELLKKLEYCEKTIALKATIEEGFVVLGERLLKIRDEELFKPQWDSWGEFLEEMRMSESKASRIITVYQTLILAYGMTKERVASIGGWDTAYTIVRNSSTIKEAQDLIDNAATLSASDFRREIKEKQTGILMKNCKHSKAYMLRICPDCGDREKVHDNE